MSLLLQACYPIYKTIRPYAEVQVFDENGLMIQDVKVVRQTAQTPARVPLRFEVAQTNDQGKVIFNKLSEWQVEHLMMIHGVQFYDWSICASKKGYETIERKVQPDAGKIIRFNLKKTQSKITSQECLNDEMEQSI